MKQLLSIALLSGALYGSEVTTDILTPKLYSEEISFLKTKDYQCNYWIETSALNLRNMALSNDRETIIQEYQNFKSNADIAIETCRYINEDISFQLEEIKEELSIFMKENN